MGTDLRRGPAWAALLLAALPWWGNPRQDEVAALRERVASLEAERDSLLERVQGLELELAQEREARLAREQQWLEYTRAIAKLAPAERLEELPPFGPQVPSVEPGGEVFDPRAEEAARARRQRAEQVQTELRALLAAEGVRGLDLMDVGSMHVHHVGPVLFRLLDDNGRLAGSLYAERLRLEASVAGRSLTLVLEQGHESHGGQRTPFGSDADPTGPAAWRIPLQGLDPSPWIESLPELFAEAPVETLIDDGLWDLGYVRVKLNELLREDVSSGWLRVRRIGGVDNGVLRDVHVEVLDPEGRLERRVFADRLTLEAGTGGVTLRFDNGVHVRGDERRPFLEGGWRVWLPRARPATWVAAGLPGLVPVPSGPASSGRTER